jgi:hypothetical protein
MSRPFFMPRLVLACLLVAGAAWATDYATLVQSLRAEKFAVQDEGPVKQPFFSVPGKVISVDGEHVQIFEYADRASAEKDAALVSPDGMTVGLTRPHWLAPPHFYRRQNVIVLYLGSDARLIKALERRLGPPFAGR